MTIYQTLPRYLIIFVLSFLSVTIFAQTPTTTKQVKNNAGSPSIAKAEKNELTAKETAHIVKHQQEIAKKPIPKKSPPHPLTKEEKESIKTSEDIKRAPAKVPQKVT